MITSFIIYVKQNLNEIWIDKMKVSKIWTRSEWVKFESDLSKM